MNLSMTASMSINRCQMLMDEGAIEGTYDIDAGNASRGYYYRVTLVYTPPPQNISLCRAAS